MGDRRDMIGGRLESDGAGWRLRFTRSFAHPAEKVWRAITEPEHLADACGPEASTIGPPG
jgi:uncharacterized protein YndB with AHSA1/START domain